MMSATATEWFSGGEALPGDVSAVELQSGRTGRYRGYCGCMTTTTTRIKAREAARRIIQERKHALDAEKRRRDQAETDLAVDFHVQSEAREAARRAENAAEVDMGNVIDKLLGELQITYSRAAKLLGQPVDELRRLRQLAGRTAGEHTSHLDQGATDSDTQTVSVKA